MDKVYLSYNNIVSAYGFDSNAAVDAIQAETTSLRLIEDNRILPQPFCASRIDPDLLFNVHAQLGPTEPYTPLEQLLMVALGKVIAASGLELNNRVGLIVSTTKGNIDILEANRSFPEKRVYLAELGKMIKTFFGFQNDAIVLSNACVSGILAIAVAKRLIQQGRYDHVFVLGGDLVSKFILSGFDALKALSSVPCRPFCKTRMGINIGELGASVLVTKDENLIIPESVALLGEASCNDANHISGPSRTGEGLFRSVRSALTQSGLAIEDIDYISAHGTATQYNDEMEAIAFNRAGLHTTPLNSLKGYIGHTLGASGLVETIIGMHSMHRNKLFASKGFQEIGVTQPLNIIAKTTDRKIDTFLKTASGFGGCNTAAIFQKVGP